MKDHKISCQVDSGATCNVIGLPILDKIFKSPRDMNIRKSN